MLASIYPLSLSLTLVQYCHTSIRPPLGQCLFKVAKDVNRYKSTARKAYAHLSSRATRRPFLYFKTSTFKTKPKLGNQSAKNT